MKKLKTAWAKAVKRLKAREGEEHEAADKAHGLTAEIAQLRKEIAQAKDPKDVEALVARLSFKVGKRSNWRKRRKKAQKRAEWWLRRKGKVGKQLKAAEDKWRKEHRLDFESWMLNGCPGDITDEIKEVIAFQVVVCGQYVTATTNGVHSSTSWHYQHKAVDTGNTSVNPMQEAAEKTRAHFGVEFFAELFSPCGWYIKNGVVYSGYFPGHGDHGHYAHA